MKKAIFVLILMASIGGANYTNTAENALETTQLTAANTSSFNQIIGIITTLALANLANYLLALPIGDWQKKNPHWAFNLGFVISSLLPQVLSKDNPLTTMVYDILQLKRTESMIQNIQSVMQLFSAGDQCNAEPQ